MKKLLIIFAVFCVFCFCGAAMSAQQFKFAYVDIEKVFSEYKGTKIAQERFEQEEKKREGELRNLTDEIRNLQKEAELLKEKEKQEKENLILQKIAELRKARVKAEQELMAMKNKMNIDIIQKIEAVVKEKGEKEGYTFVFQDRAMLYKKPEFDITAEVIEIINKKEE
ncbi:MAG: OmpH family outer membrane protein [bacterium]|nr:OmpH family outer membrane protein [bacterium]